MARGIQWSLEKIMKTPTKEIPAKDLYKAAYNLQRISNKRIEQMERKGYEVIKNQSKYYIGPNNRFLEVRKDRDSASYRRKINELKAFINSPGNDIKKIKKEQSRLRKKFKDETITNEDYIKYRKQAGKIWAKMDENEKLSGIGSERMETIIIKNVKSFNTFKAQLNHINNEIEIEKKLDIEKNSIFEKKMRELNGQ